MEIMHKFQQSTGTSTCTCIGSSTRTCTCNGTCAGAQDVDYCLTTDGLVRFKDMIYVSDNSEIKKVILREFHVKPYSGHPG